MLIFPAIDLCDGKAVRLYKGDYNQMTVYSENPSELAEAFRAAGATHMHLVDLEGAKTGETPNLETIRRIRAAVPLFIEVGGGLRRRRGYQGRQSGHPGLDGEVCLRRLRLLPGAAENRRADHYLHGRLQRWRHAGHEPRPVRGAVEGAQP